MKLSKALNCRSVTDTGVLQCCFSCEPYCTCSVNLYNGDSELSLPAIPWNVASTI
jgi:hypothetical protein